MLVFIYCEGVVALSDLLMFSDDCDSVLPLLVRRSRRVAPLDRPLCMAPHWPAAKRRDDQAKHLLPVCGNFLSLKACAGSLEAVS